MLVAPNGIRAVAARIRARERPREREVELEVEVRARPREVLVELAPHAVELRRRVQDARGDLGGDALEQRVGAAVEVLVAEAREAALGAGGDHRPDRRVDERVGDVGGRGGGEARERGRRIGGRGA